MVEFEKNGIPTVAITTEGFQTDARATVNAFGLRDIALAIFPTTLTNKSAEDVRELASSHLDSIIDGLTKEVPVIEDKPREKVLRFEAANLLEASEEMGRFFLRNGWGDGFPLVPATREKVDKMLTGTSRRPNEVVTFLEPGMAEATVEKIAINAVMAGCLPEHMPVLIAALQAMSDPKFRMRSVACSTGPHAPLLIVNGPIAKELNINSGRAALGPGAQSFANTVIGRAIRLMMMNIGHAYVGELDMDTIGSPNKYSMCIAENEEKSPWEPLHVENGFSKDTNAVTVFGVESLLEVMDLRSYTPEHLLQSYAGTANSAGACSVSVWLQENHFYENFLLLAPDHAKLIADHGWSKQDAKEYLYHKARIEWRYLKYGNFLDPARITAPWKWLLDAPEDLLLPIVGSPEWFHIVVVGGPVGKSGYMTGIGAPVTVEIRK